MRQTRFKDRYQLCLFDRLVDNEPNKKEGRDDRVISVAKSREIVVRDLECLLNSKARTSGSIINEYENARHSVLNYGVPDLCGLLLSNIDAAQLEMTILQAIKDFEPRILPSSLLVRMITPDQDEGNETKKVVIEIEGDFVPQFIPDHLYLKTEVDLETGHFKVMA